MRHPRRDGAPRVYVYRGSLPLWLALAVLAPMGLIFLTSLALAILVLGVAGVLGGLVFPRLWRRPRREESDCIELDASQYRRVDAPRLPDQPDHER